MLPKVEALIQRWREIAGWEVEEMSNPQSGQAFDQCADELEEALRGESQPLTECCDADGSGRYCPKCGWEARIRGGSFSEGSRPPTDDEINVLEKVAWDADVEHVLIWYRDRIDQLRERLREADRAMKLERQRAIHAEKLLASTPVQSSAPKCDIVEVKKEAPKL